MENKMGQPGKAQGTNMSDQIYSSPTHQNCKQDEAPNPSLKAGRKEDVHSVDTTSDESISVDRGLLEKMDTSCVQAARIRKQFEDTALAFLSKQLDTKKMLWDSDEKIRKLKQRIRQRPSKRPTKAQSKELNRLSDIWDTANDDLIDMDEERKGFEARVNKREYERTYWLMECFYFSRKKQANKAGSSAQTARDKKDKEAAPAEAKTEEAQTTQAATSMGEVEAATRVQTDGVTPPVTQQLTPPPSMMPKPSPNTDCKSNNEPHHEESQGYRENRSMPTVGQPKLAALDGKDDQVKANVQACPSMLSHNTKDADSDAGTDHEHASIEFTESEFVVAATDSEGDTDMVDAEDAQQKILEALPQQVFDIFQCRRELNKARQALVVHQATYSSQFKAIKHEQPADTQEDLAETFGPIYLLRGRNLTRKIGEAEEALDNSKKIAKDANVPNTTDQESRFASMVGEGFDDVYKQECIKTCDRKRVIDWLNHEDNNEPEILEAPDGKKRTLLKPFEVGKELAPVETWDSISAIEECPRKRRKIQVWAEQNQAQTPTPVSKRRRDSI